MGLLALLAWLACASPALGTVQEIPVEASWPIRLAGRLHPLLVHFPIGLVMSAGLLELLRLVRRRSEHSPGAFTCLTVGAFFAALAVGSGLANASAESHSRSLADVLWWHKWLGISTTILIVAVLAWGTFFRESKRPWRRRTYLGALLVCLIGIAATGHFGGTMVYGRGYLLDALRSGPNGAPPSPPANGDRDSDDAADGDLEVPDASFASVQAIFADRCYECHGPSRQRADLRLDQFDANWQQKDMYWIIVPGQADESEIVQRIERPTSQKGHMPPKGDRLTPVQIATIRKWINDGATVGPTEDKDQDVAPPDSVPGAPKLEIGQQMPALDPDPQVQPGDPDAVAGAIARLVKRGAMARPIAQDSNGVEVSFALLGDSVTDADLDLLAGLEDSLVWLNLSRTGITNDGLARLTSLAQLRRLHLEQTKITDAGLVHVGALHRLEYLNLYGTAVTDGGLEALRPLNNLRQLYLWQTKVTPEGIKALKQALPDVGILTDTAGTGDGG